MKAWAIVLAVFIFTSLSVTVNELGIFDQKAYITGSSVSADSIDTINSGIKELPANTTDDEDSYNKLNPDLGGLEIVFYILDIIKQTLGLLVLVAPTLIVYGVPSSIALLIQGVISLSEVAFLASVWRKYRVG